MSSSDNLFVCEYGIKNVGASNLMKSGRIDEGQKGWKKHNIIFKMTLMAWACIFILVSSLPYASAQDADDIYGITLGKPIPKEYKIINNDGDISVEITSKYFKTLEVELVGDKKLVRRIAGMIQKKPENKTKKDYDALMQEIAEEATRGKSWKMEKRVLWDGDFDYYISNFASSSEVRVKCIINPYRTEITVVAFNGWVGR